MPGSVHNLVVGLDTLEVGLGFRVTAMLLVQSFGYRPRALQYGAKLF